MQWVVLQLKVETEFRSRCGIPTESSFSNSQQESPVKVYYPSLDVQNSEHAAAGSTQGPENVQQRLSFNYIVVRVPYVIAWKEIKQCWPYCKTIFPASYYNHSSTKSPKFPKNFGVFVSTRQKGSSRRKTAVLETAKSGILEYTINLPIKSVTWKPNSLLNSDKYVIKNGADPASSANFPKKQSIVFWFPSLQAPAKTLVATSTDIAFRLTKFFSFCSFSNFRGASFQSLAFLKLCGFLWFLVPVLPERNF